MIAEPASGQWQLQWDLANRNTRLCVELYQSRESLLEIANGVRRFCEDRSSYEFQIDSADPERNSGYVFHWRLYALDGLGNSCIYVRYTNHRPQPYRQAAEFSIQTDRAAIEALGIQLGEFCRSPDQSVDWSERCVASV